MPLIIAHRGASFCAPENTISAFKQAIELGADGIETDIQLTADRQLVIHHNYSIDGTTDSSGRIADMTLDQLKQFDFGRHKGPEFSGEQIATLDECLETVRAMKLINLELKAPVDRSIPYVSMVVDKIKEHDIVKQTVISAFDHNLLREVKQLCPELRVGALTPPPTQGSQRMAGFMAAIIPSDVPLSTIVPEDITPPDGLLDNMPSMNIVAGNPKALVTELINSMVALYPHSTLNEVFQTTQRQSDLVEYVKSLDFHVDYLHPEYHSALTDESLIPRLAALGVGVSPYTPDSQDELTALYKQNCYGIITNRPDILRSIAQSGR